VAAAMATKEALWLRKLLGVLGVDGQAVPMGEDNQSCLALITNPEATGRTKHVDVAYHMVRDYQTRGDVAFYFLPSAEMPANGLTKPLPSPAFTAFTEIEGLGVVWAVGVLRPYIIGTKFLIRCDHKALKWILITTACTNNRLNRWRVLLSELDYDVGYKPGPQHAVADARSRLPTEGPDTGPISREIPTVGVTTRSGAVLDPRPPENRETARIPLGELAQKQADDEFC